MEWTFLAPRHSYLAESREPRPRARCLRCMASSPQTDCKSSEAAQATLAKPLAPEDVRPGDFVTLLFVIAEYGSFWWFMESWDQPPEEPVRIRYTPGSSGGIPLKVRSVCLPFVLVKAPSGDHSTLDLRTCQLARLSRSHARRAWKAIKLRSKKTAPAVSSGNATAGGRS